MADSDILLSHISLLGFDFVVNVCVPDSFSLNAKMQTKKSMESSIPYVVLSILYAYLLYLSWTPETVRLIFASKYLLPEVCMDAFNNEVSLPKRVLSNS